MDESDSEAIESALKVGVSGFLARTSPVSQIVSALITAATGGIALSPSVMNKIADKLSISYYTVDTHIRNLHRKLRVKNSRGLITVAMRRRLI